MTQGDVAFAQACVRGVYTALSAFKAWMTTQPPSPEDERFMHALDIAADAAKEWVRGKAAQLKGRE